jgi:hypothetical protein
MAFESPVSKGILSWWSDCYGECPRMFYQAFAGVPEWAPPHQNHILYSEGILKDVSYTKGSVSYYATVSDGIEYLKLAFKPGQIIVNGNEITEDASLKPDTYKLEELDNGDYTLTIRHKANGKVSISESSQKM